MPEVDPQLSDIVVFLAYWSGGEEVAGTAFLVTSPAAGWDREAFPPDPVPRGMSEDDRRFWLVTARHVIDGIARANSDHDPRVLVWINTAASGRTTYETKASDWLCAVDEPGDGLLRDIAILPFELRPEYSLRAFPIEASATASRVEHARIHPGADVVYPSLFYSRPGGSRNTPLVRVGTLAALADPEEPFFIEAVAKDTVAHIVEARSYRGVSGSPVFAVLPPGRTFRDSTSEGTYMRMSTRGETYLLGVMATHWDLRALELESFGPLNLGLAAVMPVELVIDEIEHHSSP